MYNKNKKQYDGPPTCNDYKDRKGCGAVIKLLKDKEGRTQAVDPVMIPTFDREGEFEYRYIPHWVGCRANEGRYQEYLEKKIEEQKRWQAENDDRNGNTKNRNGYQKASYSRKTPF